MNSWFFILLIVVAIAGLPFVLGPALANREMRRAARLLDSILNEADKRGVTETPGFKAIAFCFAGMVYCAPHVAAGVVPPKSETPATFPDMTSFIEENEWVHSYLMSLYLSFNLLRFIGRPWLPRYWLSAFFAEVLFRLFSAENGTVTLVYESDSLRKAMKDIPPVDPKELRLSGASYI